VTLRPYSILALGAILAGFAFWLRLAKRDLRLLWIYLAALAGAFAGAKLVYFGAEGWRDLDRMDAWLRLATGKSILGGLLGGYAAVELVKAAIGYKGVTGDWFALVVPIGIGFGRVGCWIQGCCAGIECAPSWFTVNDAQGIARWPSAPAELVFNVAFLGAVLWLRRRNLLTGQHFHLYLIAYGAFRFAHEFFRAEPRLFWVFTGYHIAAMLVLTFGVWRFIVRKEQQSSFAG
jgi:phosphatidylglycerol---prolipoprotein diacylglyceryl transferase